MGPGNHQIFQARRLGVAPLPKLSAMTLTEADAVCARWASRAVIWRSRSPS